ncbi:hypothetical protein [Bacillus dakarensis]|uniref:hypothetical protein n=1 Tax=Robertmurraya dakarensis TaxID=1926278 RepID=UPI0009816743|nr:hypothetical protein [Bacillus dakarensis]
MSPISCLNILLVGTFRIPANDLIQYTYGCTALIETFALERANEAYDKMMAVSTRFLHIYESNGYMNRKKNKVAMADLFNK